MRTEVRCEVMAVGTELLLGDVVDTNSAWLGTRLAEAGVDCHFQTRVGDNVDRIVAALESALDRSEVVVVCGGLGPTPDDVTREALAEVMGVALEPDAALLEHLRELFADRGRELDRCNERQGEMPRGAVPILPNEGTAPGLICPLGDKIVYVLPGVPSEMREMADRAVFDDLRERFGIEATIVSRVLRIWGVPESEVAEAMAPRLAALDRTGNPTAAFLASATDGVGVRLTAKAAAAEAAHALLRAEEAEVRRIFGSAAYGVNGQRMEHVVGELLEASGLSLGLAESLTAGLVASRLVAVEGASGWFSGAVICYDSRLKFDLLGVRPGPVITEEAAQAMAEGAVKVLGTTVGLSLTGVAGPEEQEGTPVGTVFVGVCVEGETEVSRLALSGDRDRIRQVAATASLDLVRRRLMGRLG